jgi:outer membrane biogenesis lipoprotein LolB
MRVLVVLVAMLLVACAEPKPDQPEEVPDDELFDCELSKDKKFIVCYDRKRREVATKGKNE